MARYLRHKCYKCFKDIILVVFDAKGEKPKKGECLICRTQRAFQIRIKPADKRNEG